MTSYIENETNVEFDFPIKEVADSVILQILDSENCPYEATVNILITDNEGIRQYNADYRGIDKETDVLSFPLGENGIYDENPETGAMMLGDIVISLEKALQQAEMYGHSVAREVAFLTVHSMHHLLGYDHENGGEEEKTMRRKEEEVLVKMGLPRTVSIQITEE